MHKCILKAFDFAKRTAEFIKIAVIFLMLLLLLYWAQNLIGSDWGWMNFIEPFLSFLVSLGEKINNYSFELFGAVFELKYAVSLGLLILVYCIFHYVLKGIYIAEDMYDDGRRAMNKAQEKLMNAQLANDVKSEQMKINNYKIMVSTSVKKKFSHRELNINLEEQNIIMNKFLIKNLGVSPVKFEDGFLYSFSNFSKIDSVLEIFFKVINSNAPLNYYISVQVCSGDVEEEAKALRRLNGLKIENKIIMKSDTSYRYKYNEFHKYGTTQIGLFQKERDTVEVQCFKELGV